jgi:AcrR family transcriptional regulator
MAAEDTRQKIIDATGELASERGLDNVSTRAIAERSGENIGSIHYHFGGKEGLFAAVAAEAMKLCRKQKSLKVIATLNAESTPQELSKAIRIVVAEEITNLFRSGRPLWHAQIIYQLLQRDDYLYEQFHKEVLNPDMDAMSTLLKAINPRLCKEEIFLQTCAMKMPIFAHAHYMKAMLKRLQVDHYSEAYLQKLEDMITHQTLLSLGLPDDQPL